MSDKTDKEALLEILARAGYLPRNVSKRPRLVRLERDMVLDGTAVRITEGVVEDEVAEFDGFDCQFEPNGRLHSLYGTEEY